MQALKELWQDELGLILSAEAVTVGTLGVLGAVVGLNMASTAVDEELKDFAYAIRSLDQSFGFTGRQSCQAWSAGSSFRQQDVQVSLSDLCANGASDAKTIQEQVETHTKTHLPAAPHPQADPADHAVPVAPNKIGVPVLSGDKAKSVETKDEAKPDFKPKPDKKSPKKRDQDESDRND